jgi:hypothetical protein
MVALSAGQMITLPEGARNFPKPKDINVGEILKSNSVFTESARPLPHSAAMEIQSVLQTPLPPEVKYEKQPRSADGIADFLNNLEVYDSIDTNGRNFSSTAGKEANARYVILRFVADEAPSESLDSSFRIMDFNVLGSYETSEEFVLAERSPSERVNALTSINGVPVSGNSEEGEEGTENSSAPPLLEPPGMQQPPLGELLTPVINEEPSEEPEDASPTS